MHVLLCVVCRASPIQNVIMLYVHDMLYPVYFGLRSDAGRGPSYSGLRSDVGRGPMQWAGPSMCYLYYGMICGSLRELTKLRAYNFSF